MAARVASRGVKKPVAVRTMPAAEQLPDNSYGIASLVCGIASILVPVFGVVLGILAIVFYTKQRKVAPSGMATAGLILGIVGLVLQLLIAAYFFLALLYILGSAA